LLQCTDFKKLDGFRALSPWRSCGLVADARLDVIFWAACGPQLAPAPAAGKRRPGSPCASPRPRGGGCACFSEFLRPSEALRACSCQIFAFSLPRTGFTSRHRSPRDFPSLKSQRRSKPHILAGCSARRSPHQPALRRSTSLLQRRDPPSAPSCCLPELRANLSDMPNEGR
jgi:hypothetical protein